MTARRIAFLTLALATLACSGIAGDAESGMGKVDKAERAREGKAEGKAENGEGKADKAEGKAEREEAKAEAKAERAEAKAEAEMADAPEWAKGFTQRTGVVLSMPTRQEIGDAPWVAADREKVEQLTPAIEAVFAKYQDDVRGGIVKKLVVYQKCTAPGHTSGGLALPKEHGFVLTVMGKNREVAIVDTMHHEIGHLVMNEAPPQGWPKISAGKYRNNDTTHKEDEDAMGTPEDYYDAGFVSRYGSKNVGEDFAEFAALGMTDPEKLLSLAEKYPKIAQKTLLLDETYGKVVTKTPLPWRGPRLEALRAAAG